jgi:AraC-like DNA-binding protein
MHLLDGGKEGMLTPLPLPMPGLGIQLSVTADELAAAASDALDTQMAWGINGGPSPLFELFRYIDRVLLEEPYLADGLALDDQAYRLVAIAIAQKAYPAQLARQQTGKRRWSSSLDELVDYIASNRCSAITLTELEEQSNYSRRHLQNLFRERFGCTPMQFVRRQRLTAAMEKLQAAEERTTVSRVARDCGYRSISNFSSDFQRFFGEQPSQVLRRSTRQQTRSRSSPPSPD